MNESQSLSKIPIVSAGVWCSIEVYAVNCPFPQCKIFTSVPPTSVKLKYKIVFPISCETYTGFDHAWAMQRHKE